MNIYLCSGSKNNMWQKGFSIKRKLTIFVEILLINPKQFIGQQEGVV